MSFAPPKEFTDTYAPCDHCAFSIRRCRESNIACRPYWLWTEGRAEIKGIFKGLKANDRMPRVPDTNYFERIFKMED